MTRTLCALLLCLVILPRLTWGEPPVSPNQTANLFDGLKSYAESGGQALSTADARQLLERVLVPNHGSDPAATIEKLLQLTRPAGVLSLRHSDQVDEDAFAAEQLAVRQRWRDAWLSCSRTAIADNPRYVYDYVLAAHHPASRALSLTLAAVRNTAPDVDLERSKRTAWRREVARRLWSEEVSSNAAAEISALQRRVRESLWRVGGGLHRTLEAAPAMQQAYQSNTNWLLGSLPSHTALIDLQRYTPVAPERSTEHGGAGSDEPHYCAFLVAAGQTRGRIPQFAPASLQPVWQPEGDFLVARIELGPAAALEAAAEAWGRAIRGGRPDRALGQELAGLLWKPLHAQLPADVETIVLCADGPLGQLPWCALPLTGEDVLLDRYRLACVPFPQFLVLWLTLTPDDLTWGHFDGEADRFDLLGAADAALPTAPQELVQLQRLVPQLKMELVHGADLTAERVLATLPRATVAHFALHGSFSPTALAAARRGGLLSVGAVNEIDGLHYSALHLRPAAGRPRQEGLLTASMLTELHLTHLQLVVLAACQTGQGHAPLGEGALSFVHALHWAGCANVVGTRWSVDDQQTSLLMAQFYERLWRQGLTPLDALRGAQLHLYRNPSNSLPGPNRIPVDERQLLDGSSAVRSTERGGVRTATRHWAAFFLSGAGGLRAPGHDEGHQRFDSP
jgi:CHAT domain-containing protein